MSCKQNRNLSKSGQKGHFPRFSVSTRGQYSAEAQGVTSGPEQEFNLPRARGQMTLGLVFLASGTNGSSLPFIIHFMQILNPHVAFPCGRAI